MIRALITFAFALLMLACTAADRPIGMSLLFQSAGRPVLVEKFDPDGEQGPVPGSVGSMSPRGGAQMSFMPGDSKKAVPTFINVEWSVPTPEFDRWAKLSAEKTRTERHSEEGEAEYARQWAAVPTYKQRVDVTSIITPELVKKVRADSRNTQLQLIITFNTDKVDIKAVAEKWR